ncbi:hypothetical protein [Streptomyces sp. NPDC029704]|uniref:hypothetical protein n=1 Tax=Streptomyces sp. NPDC029704 TaxID=3156920 RepID=UPI0033FA24FE
MAVDDGRRLTEAERDGARTAFGIPAEAAAVCLVGGWWLYKDIATVDAALSRLTSPLHLVVTGTPLDEEVLARWHQLPQVRLHTVPGPVGEQVLRLVYAAADATLVTRRPGGGKESGLAMDAARLGVSLIVSDHDPALTRMISGHPGPGCSQPATPAPLPRSSTLSPPSHPSGPGRGLRLRWAWPRRPSRPPSSPPPTPPSSRSCDDARPPVLVAVIAPWNRPC